MKKILNMVIQNKTAKGAYITMVVCLLMTLFFTLIRKEFFVEVLGIIAFVSLTVGVLIELILSMNDKKI